MKQRELTPVAQWLVEECRAQSLSWREASQRAGVDKGTISAIVRGAQPGLEVCKALATFFRKPPEYALRLAGHLHMIPSNLPPEAMVLLQELEQLSPAQQMAALKMWRTILEMTKAARAAEPGEMRSQEAIAPVP